MNDDEVYEGRWSQVGNLAVPDEGIGRILDKEKQLRYLTDQTAGNQDISIYVQDEDATFWELIRPEPAVARLRRVTRRYIEDTYPELDLDRLLKLMP